MQKKAFSKKEAAERLLSLLEEDFYGDINELHNEVFNYGYVSGYVEAEKNLEGYGIFDAIRKVQEYEKLQFGETITDIADPEKLANMLFYIVGQELIDSAVCDIEELQENYSVDENNKEIFAEYLEKILK